MASKDRIKFIDPVADVMYEGQSNIHTDSKLGSFNQKILRPDKIGVESRLYLRGDPIKAIDWKNYAKTDQLTIRQSRDESQAEVVIYIDYSVSMCWPTNDEVESIGLKIKPIEKFQMAMRVGLSLAYGHVRRGDKVEIVIFDGYENNIYSWIPRRFSQIAEMFYSYEKSDFSSDEIIKFFTVIDDLNHKEFEVGYYISDVIASDYGDRIVQRGLVKNLFLLHSLSNLECDIDWFEKGYNFSEDLDKNDQIKSVDLLKNNKYLNGIEEWKNLLRSEKESLGYRYVGFTDESSIVSLKTSINL